MLGTRYKRVRRPPKPVLNKEESFFELRAVHLKTLMIDGLLIGTNKILIKDRTLDTVVRKAFDEFRTDSVNPIHIREIFDYDIDEVRLSKPGYPWEDRYENRNDVMNDPKAEKNILWFWHKVKAGEEVSTCACKIRYRAFVNRKKAAIRIEYEYSTTLTLMEVCFGLPLKNEQQRCDTPMAFDNIVELKRRFAGCNYFAFINYKYFDKTVTKQLTQYAFAILRQNMDFTKYDNYGIPDPRKLHRAWHFLERYFVYTPLVAYNGSCWIKRGGIPNGSFFADLIRPIVHWILINYAFYTVYEDFPEYAMGFDNNVVVASTQDFELDDIIHTLHDCGAIVNTQSCFLTDNVEDIEMHRIKLL